MFCVQTRFTHRDYNVTGDTIGTLDEVMHLSVLLIPCFKSCFPLGLHLPIQGHECVEVVSDKHSDSSHVLSPALRMSLEVTKVANAPLWLRVCVCKSASVIVSVSRFIMCFLTECLAPSDDLPICQYSSLKASAKEFQLKDSTNLDF